jgi:glycosyltransferase involved in cell wall biosynthesis
LADVARLSVIVPVHNAERYLRACLDSLVVQTRPIDELLLVDDGSTDDSAAILERYAGLHPAIRILRGPRRGAAGARNTGLERATGDWIAFADADDWVEPDMYRRLVSLLEKNSLDIALCNARYHYEGRAPDRPIYTDAPLAGPLAGKDWLSHKIENRSLLHMVWMHLYRRGFIEEHRLRFTEGLMHEDVTWTTRALSLAGRVAYDDAPLYVYRRQPRHFTRKALDAHLQRVIETAMTDARMLEELADGSADARLARAIRWQLVDGGLSVFHKIRQLSTAELRRVQWLKVLREKFFALLWRNAIETRQKRKVATRWLRALATRVFT